MTRVTSLRTVVFGQNGIAAGETRFVEGRKTVKARPARGGAAGVFPRPDAKAFLQPQLTLGMDSTGTSPCTPLPHQPGAKAARFGCGGVQFTAAFAHDGTVADLHPPQTTLKRRAAHDRQRGHSPAAFTTCSA